MHLMREYYPRNYKIMRRTDALLVRYDWDPLLTVNPGKKGIKHSCGAIPHPEIQLCRGEREVGLPLRRLERNERADRKEIGLMSEGKNHERERGSRG